VRRALSSNPTAGRRKRGGRTRRGDHRGERLTATMPRAHEAAEPAPKANTRTRHSATSGPEVSKRAVSPTERTNPAPRSPRCTRPAQRSELGPIARTRVRTAQDRALHAQLAKQPASRQSAKTARTRAPSRTTDPESKTHGMTPTRAASPRCPRCANTQSQQDGRMSPTIAPNSPT
jgi:hypothetical protein